MAQGRHLDIHGLPDERFDLYLLCLLATVLSAKVSLGSPDSRAMPN